MTMYFTGTRISPLKQEVVPFTITNFRVRPNLVVKAGSPLIKAHVFPYPGPVFVHCVIKRPLITTSTNALPFARRK